MALGGSRGSNGKTNSQDYTNLLFSDSDSDTRIPDLKLPPVKGKKQKKKRGGLVYRHEETSCGLWSVVKACLLLVLLTGVVSMAGISFWSLRKISTLEEVVDRLQQSDAFTPDSMTKFQTQLVALNKSLTELRSGEGGTKALASSVEELKTKVKAFEDTSKELNKQLVSSKEVLDLPHRINELTKVVVTMKSDVMGASQKQKDIESRLDELEKKLETQSPGTETETNESTRANEQIVTQLAEEVKLMNQTMNLNLALIRQFEDEQETRMSTLTDFIKNSAAAPSPMDPDLIEDLVKQAIHDSMGNITTSGLLPTGEMDGMLKQVDAMVQKMEALKTAQQDELVSKGDFMVFKEVVMDNFKVVNESVLSFNEELEEHTLHISGLESYMTNVSQFIESLRSQLSEETSSSEPITPPAEKSTSQGDTNGEMKKGEEVDTEMNKETDSENKEEIVETGANSAGHIAEGGQETTTPENMLQQLIHVENITNMSELAVAFTKDNPLGGALDLTQLNVLLGSTSLTQDQLELIDTNKDEMFSLDEIARATGLMAADSSLPGPR